MTWIALILTLTTCLIELRGKDGTPCAFLALLTWWIAALT